ncbi:MAG: nucleotide-binding domain containing protein, partial [Bacteroidota bacterium]
YAQDSAFGYRNSDLKDWVAEKTAGKVEAASVVSFSIEELRTKSIAQLVEKLEAEQSSDCYIVNAVDYTDLEIFAYALLQTSIPFVCRTAASFVAALAALPDKPLLKKSDLVQADATNGGLIIVGSHVPKTTRQLEHLRRSVDVEAIELDVQKLINDYEQRVALAKQYSIAIDQLIAKGRDVVLYTSRAVVIADSAADNLSIGAKISAFLSRVVAQLQHRPKYVLAKGGITSSDVATVSLGVKRAVVIGQVLPGIPVWRLGKSSKFPDLSYLIFPGNVGEDDAIASVVQALV